jgi:predicted ATP-grasp superfamily ATP-dependent carboligase
VRPPDPTARILVSDVEGRAGLAAARGLSKAGYFVAGASSARLTPGFWSRACSRRVRVRSPYADPEGFVDDLTSAMRRHEFRALLPITDVDLELVSAHRDLLPPGLVTGLPRHDVVERCLDKDSLEGVACAFDLSPPASVTCEDGDTAGVLEAARELGYPVVLKPRRSVVALGSRLARRGARLARTADEVRRLAPTLGRSVLVQQFEPGAHVLSVGGVIVPDGLLASVTARWSRTWPPLDGAASFCETVEPPAGLLERVECMLREIGHVGLFELELLERDDGTLAALDVNPRAFGWMTLSIRADANLPAVWCDWLLGREPARVSARPGVRYRREDGDARNFLWQLRRGRFRKGLAVLRPRTDVAHAYFELRDPAPLPAVLIQLAGRRAGALARTRSGSEVAAGR